MAGVDAADLLSEWSVVPDSGRALHAEVALERDATTLEASELKAVLSVVAPPADATARAPLRLVVVLDKSGSMHGEKLRLVKKTMLFMLRHLSERDALGIVEYDTEVKLTAPLTYCSAEGRAHLEAALKRLAAGSQTNLSGGLLRGLRVHREGVRSAAQAQQPPQQRLSIGNTYRRLTPEEAEGREHFGLPGASPPEGAERVHEWTMALRFQDAEDEALVQKVVFRLHETFRDPVVEVLEAPFQITRLGWGYFNVVADVHLRDGRVTSLQHQLSFERPETFRTVLLPLRSLPAGLDYVVNGAKKVRVTSLELEDGATSLRSPGAEGRTLHLDGVSYGAWGARRRTTVPAELPGVAERVVALFQGCGAEESVAFTDTDGDEVVFVATGPARAPPAAELADAEAGLVRSTFLFTDGLANHGITKPDEICAAAQAAIGELQDQRCMLSTFGFGKDHNADLLQALSEVGGGVYSYIEGEDSIGEAFGEALGGLLSTTHQNVQLSLELAPGVGLARAFTAHQVDGPTPGAGGDSVVRIDLGDLYAEERRDVLVALALPGAAAEGRQVLGQLQAEGFSVLAKRTETAAPLAFDVERTAGADVQGSSHPQVERHWLRHVATEALEAARAAAQRGDLVAARRLLAASSESLAASPLTASGDATCTGLLVDLNDCRKDLEHEESYRAYGSKKMACMQQAHMRQRACTGQTSDMYSNTISVSMKAMFKAGCQ